MVIFSGPLQREERQDIEELIPPDLVQPSLPFLTPMQIDTDHLQEMFGRLTAQQTESNVTIHDRRGNSYPPSKIGSERSNSTKTLMSVPSVIAGVATPSMCHRIACLGPNRALVLTHDERLQLVDRRGFRDYCIGTKIFIIDICATPQGDILISDFKHKCIDSLSLDKTITMLFKTKWEPTGLCCLEKGDIVVSFCSRNRINIYMRTGEIIQTITDVKNKNTFRTLKWPNKVVRNKVNNDLCFSNNDMVSEVLVVDENYKLRFVYSGSGEDNLSIRDLCTDNVGHILIISFHRVHLLDSDGHLLQYLLSGDQRLIWPHCIDVDIEDNVWLGGHDKSGGEWGGIVKIVKYLQ